MAIQHLPSPTEGPYSIDTLLHRSALESNQGKGEETLSSIDSCLLSERVSNVYYEENLAVAEDFVKHSSPLSLPPNDHPKAPSFSVSCGGDDFLRRLKEKDKKLDESIRHRDRALCFLVCFSLGWKTDTLLKDKSHGDPSCVPSGIKLLEPSPMCGVDIQEPQATERDEEDIWHQFEGAPPSALASGPGSGSSRPRHKGDIPPFLEIPANCRGALGTHSVTLKKYPVCDGCDKWVALESVAYMRVAPIGGIGAPHTSMEVRQNNTCPDLASNWEKIPADAEGAGRQGVSLGGSLQISFVFIGSVDLKELWFAVNRELGRGVFVRIRCLPWAWAGMKAFVERSERVGGEEGRSVLQLLQWNMSEVEQGVSFTFTFPIESMPSR
uniref:Uncharacterized protein n=1 Tax=Chromera velia CCMP2878 TaxID=1169474 RepID=A0A0G4G023_9ALVE|eukprot:Cvel_19542.t1-p1 / transcript=Cvel_19542.t1 / gene=Cvel_19542 / organism=Chromera_velia_CCMP2878 / gene_product=hypothetical protein / transcript_product=hypothetical protein / location=Cvel_scaffold1692:31605-35948(+) / protein_length=381 / sequence_SO=supercontig / SO=protein_coding / is_pseudo=false